MSGAPVEIIDAAREHGDAIAAIYNAGLASRTATFETRPRSAAEIEQWLGSDVPVKIALVGGVAAAFASTSAYRPRACYAGIREYSVYVSPDHYRKGLGTQVLNALIEACRERGIHKLVSRIFPENTASIELAKKCGFRVVGTYLRHGKLEGAWKDCVIVELNL